jgi:predicted NBD/HSP70 family sugar kinase
MLNRAAKQGLETAHDVADSKSRFGRAMRRSVLCLVFDIGGTNLRAALYDPSTDSLRNLQVRPTPNSWNLGTANACQVQAALYREMREVSVDVLEGRAPDLVSVAFPGPIDNEGNLLAAPTVWGSGSERAIPLQRELNRLWPSALLMVLNDVSAAGYWYQCGPQDTFCVVTVSSGIGNKVFVNGRPMIGHRGQGGEIGHLRVDFSNDAAECDCGGRGHIGGISSGRGALALARKLVKRSVSNFSGSLTASLCGGKVERLTNEMIVKGFHHNDEWSVSLVRAISRPLGWALAAIHHALGIERFVIIGGFALALGEGYRRQLVSAALESGWNLGQDWNSMLELGHLGDQASLLGAGRYAITQRGAIE